MAETSNELVSELREEEEWASWPMRLALRRRAADEIERLTRELQDSGDIIRGQSADIIRLLARGAAYEEAFRIAYQATHQSHTGHWDMQGTHGANCPECRRAAEAREECDKVIRNALSGAPSSAPETKECPHCREVYEIWAGSDGMVPETAPETYQKRLIHQMRDAAARGLAQKASEKP